MADYIDRQEVIETVAFYREDPDGIDHALNSIKNIPSADVAPMEWIPVTERLPDFEGCLLCMRKTVFGLSVQEVLYYEDGEFSYNGIDNLKDGAVTHWMPLPKPPVLN